MDSRFKNEFITFKEDLRNVLDKTDLHMIKSIIIEYVGRYPLCCVYPCDDVVHYPYISCHIHCKIMCTAPACTNFLQEHILMARHRVCEIHLKDYDSFCKADGCHNLKHIEYNGYELVCLPYCIYCRHY